MLEKTVIHTTLFFAVVMLSNIIQTVTGFAGTMLAMPASMLLVGMENAKAVLNAVAIVISILVVAKDFKYVNVREVKKITFFMLVGMLAGIYLIHVMPAYFLQHVYGVLIIAVALKKIFVRREIHLPKTFMAVVLFLAGVIHGMFVSGGSLLVIYAVTVLKDKRRFRATLASIWIILNGILLLSHVKAGYFTGEVLSMTAVAVPVAVFSVWIGNKLHERINQALFLKITYFLLLISGIMLFI